MTNKHILMRIRKNGELVEVGDKIIVDSGLGTHKFPVTRVTKTLALSKREDDGFEFRFKRLVAYDMVHPQEKWNTSKYYVITTEEFENESKN